MKKKIVLIIVMLIPFIVRAQIDNNYERSTNYISNYIESLEEYKLYLVQGDNTPYKYESGVLSSDSSFKKGGLLNILEFNTSKDSEGSTYLFDGLSYWTMTTDNSNQYVISLSTINRYESKSKSETSGLRVSEYVKSNVRVTGVGTYSNPWKFVRPGYDITLILENATYNGQTTYTETIASNSASYVISPTSGYAVSSINCTNGNIQYNSYTLTINNITGNSECELKYTNPGKTFTYLADTQTYEVPSSGYYEIDAYGAQGGNSGGLGGEIKGKVYLNKGETLTINTGGINGYNGGGTGSYTGGGATTVKLNETTILTGAGGGGGTGGSNGGNGTGSGGASTISSGTTVIDGTAFAGGSATIIGAGGGSGNKYYTCTAYNSCVNSTSPCATYKSCQSSSCGCATYKSCQNSSCGCATYNSCRDSSCGCETRNSCRDSSCGCETYNSCRATTCGCDTYKSCATSACGCSTYKTCTNSACGCSTYKTCATSACGCSFYNHTDWEATSTSTTVATTCANSTGDLTKKVCYWVNNHRSCKCTTYKRTKECGEYKTCDNAACGCSTYKSCSTSACGCATYKTCTNAACGCSLYKSCVNSSCTCATYKSCQNSSCSCATYKSCQNSSCSCATYSSCRDSSCGCQTYDTCRSSSCGCETYSSTVHSSCGCKTRSAEMIKPGMGGSNSKASGVSLQINTFGIRTGNGQVIIKYISE